MKSRTVKIDYLARVEGEGSLYIKVKKGEIIDLRFSIFEAPRFFEAFLRGRSYQEVPDITARICGICPVAYVMSSIYAFESLFEIKVEKGIRDLRKLLYFGDWIQSHALHAFMLHAPDFLGYDDALKMAKDHPEIVRKALRVKRIGNDIMSFIGGREIHPVSACIGGFYKVPTKAKLESIKGMLEEGLKLAEDLTRWASEFEYPDFEQDYEFVSLRHPDEYGIIEGRIVSNKGLNIAVNEYDEYFEEYQVPYSNALQSRIKGRGSYMVGPLARFNLNFDKLLPRSKSLAEEIGFKPPIKNPFKSILARCIEIAYGFEESLRIVNEYVEPSKPRVEVKVRAGTGYGCTEAPRGSLYHRYEVDERGIVLSAKIVPPTSQNQLRMEDDLRALVPKILDLPKKEFTWRCEQAIRNYDPCISCATHFLKVEIERL